MRAVPLGQDDFGELYCFLCRRTLDIPHEKLYSLTTEDGEEYDKLELILGESSNWFICKECLGIVEESLGHKIIISTIEEIIELEDSLYLPLLDEEGSKAIRDNLVAINERKCPSCGHPIRESFDYMTYDEDWGKKMHFRSITLSCHKCDFSPTLGPPITDAALGYFLTGTILDYDSHFIKIEVSPSYKEVRKRCEKNKPLVIKHKVDLPVLGVYQGLMDLIEILVIDNIVVRVSG